MNESTHEAIIQRLARLEQENRRWKMLGLCAVVLLGLVVLLGATTSKVVQEIRTKRLILLDKDGRERAKLEMHSERGGPYLDLYDKDGRVGASLSITSTGGSFLSLLSKDESDAKVSLSVGGDGAGLWMSDRNALILLGAKKDQTHAHFSGTGSSNAGVLSITIPARSHPAGEGKPDKRIAMSLIDQGRFAWTIP
jgi:hypothetical protein